ncbi:MAG: peptidase S10 [Acidobacteria bacterium]|nr:peptidase S10 [Acidobacteriota bacterium]
MRKLLAPAAMALFLPLCAQDAHQAKPDLKAPKAGPKDEAAALPKPVSTHHQITASGKVLKYTATVGYMPLSDAKGDREAKLFYTAYTLDGGGSNRPLIFCFNGGPGSSSIWLHLGCIGPRRVHLQADGELPPPPFHLEDNNETWLDQADLVFIDPVGTGFSKTEKPEDAKKYWSLRGDVSSVADFIRLYLTRNERWTSPLFLAGESYGTTRASALSSYLLNQGVALNGVILISSIMNFQTTEFARGNDLPFELFLPSYATTAWYHKKLGADLQALPVAEVAAQAKAFATGAYADALRKGDLLTPTERNDLAQKIARFTGLSPAYVLQSNLRPVIYAFTSELLRDQNRLIGRLEARFKQMPSRGTEEMSETDPLMAAITPPYTSCFNDYVRRDLGFETDDPYETLSYKVNGAWDWNSDNSMVDTSTKLSEAFRKNPYMKLFVANGYYDLGTPFFATEYTLDHMGLEPAMRARISLGFYEAGHMIYIDDAQRAKLRGDVRGFIASALSK